MAIVANPYLVSLDGQASVDFVLSDIRKQKLQKKIPQEVINRRKESNLRRLSRIQLSKVLNRNLQTKVTRKYRQSESLFAEEIFKKSRLEDIETEKNGGLNKK